MGKRKRYREYWKKKLNYDYEEEYNVYKYLCGGMRHKRQEKKIPKERRFEAYSAWKEDVTTCYETRDLDKLKEFRRYLNKCSRAEKSTKGMSNALCLPLYTVFATLVLTQIDWANIINEIGNFTNNMLGYDQSLRAIISFLAVTWIGMMVFLLLIVLLPMFFMIINILKTAISEGEIEAFYENYIEIIDEVIAQKETVI